MWPFTVVPDLSGTGAPSCVSSGAGVANAGNGVEIMLATEAIAEDDVDFFPLQLLQIHSLNLFLPLTVSGRGARHTEQGG